MESHSFRFIKSSAQSLPPNRPSVPNQHGSRIKRGVGRFIRQHEAQIFLTPGFLLLFLAFMAPICLLLLQSLFDPGLTAKHYARIIQVPVYSRILWNSIKLQFLVSVLTLVAGYPLAYVMNSVGERKRVLMMMLVLTPFWTNVLVRCYAWIIILQSKGVINHVLVDWLGIFPVPLPLVFNFTGDVIGMVYYLLPFMVLILFSVMRSIDLRLVNAAQSLGANPWRAFWRIFLPLSMPGVQGATILTFIIGLGFFITPALMGGRDEINIAMLIDTQFAELLNWGFGSALAALLLVVTLSGVIVSRWLAARSAVTVVGS